MSLPQNLGRLSAALTSDASLNIGVGVTPSGSFKLEVGTTSKFTGVATFGSTLSNGTYSYTLPGATGTLALTSDLSGYVTLATSQTISGEKTFSAIRTNINGALVVKSGAATGVIIESFTANYLSLGVTSGVTTYTQNLIFPASSANSYTFPSATGTLALTSALSSYLPLSGGTLTGALSGTSATFSGLVDVSKSGQAIRIYAITTDATYQQIQNTSGNIIVGNESSVGGVVFSGTTTYSGIIGTASTKDFFIGTNSVQRLKIDGSTGAATFSSSVTASGTKPQLYVSGNSSAGSGIHLTTALSGTNRRNWGIFTEEAIDGDFVIKCSTAAGLSPDLGNARLAISRDGNVGIGTTSPASKLHVFSANGTTYASTAQLRVDGGGVNNNYAQIIFSDSALSDGKISYYPASVEADRFFSISARTTESDFIIRGDGKVGIGTTSPGFILDVQQAQAITRVLSTTGTNSSSTRWSNTGGSLYVGIDQSASGALLTGDSSYAGVIARTGAYPLQFGTNDVVRMTISSDGTITLGNTSSSAIAVMTFGGGFANQTTLDANTRFQGPNNSVTAAKCYAWNTYSDQRIKEDILPLSYGLNEILQLKPVSYNQYDSEIIDDTLVLKETYKATIGLIAQEVNNSIPESVAVGNDTELWGLDYTKLIPVLVKAIQELSEKIKILENK
jgi:hypothetical protein